MNRNGLPAIERKSLAWDQVIEDRVVTGFGAVVGNVDDGGDVLLPGAFVKTVQERAERLRYLWMHDASQMPIANIVEIAEVGQADLPAKMLEKHPDAVGGLKVSREYLETPRGEEALTAVRKGAIRELSFAYDAIAVGTPEEVLRWGKGCRRMLKEVRLWEVSDVNWGMNSATMNVKAAVAALLTNLPKEPGPERQKALAEWLEARIHLNFTEMADYMFGDGYLTREERIALSGLIGDALDVFHQGMVADDALQGVRTRGRWEAAPVVLEAPPAVEPAAAGAGGFLTAQELAERAKTSAALGEAVVRMAAAQATAERKRRVQVALRQIALVG